MRKIPQRISINDFSDELIQRTKDEFDNVIIEESGSMKGTGKTVFSMLSSMDICKKQGFKYSLEENMVIDAKNETIAEKIKSKPFGYPIHIDEAIKVAYRRNWNEDPQKKLMELIAVCRKHHKIVHANNPAFITLDKDLLDLADYRVIILQRGYALVFGKLKDPNEPDKWMIKEANQLMKDRKINRMDVDEVINVLRNMKNCIYEIKFGNVDPKLYERYEALSREMELKSFIEADADSMHARYEALVGIVNILKDTYQTFTWPEVTKAINKYIAIKEKKGVLTPSRVREVASEAMGVGLDDWFKPHEMKLNLESTALDVALLPLNNNNNNIPISENGAGQDSKEEVEDAST